MFMYVHTNFNKREEEWREIVLMTAHLVFV